MAHVRVAAEDRYALLSPGLQGSAIPTVDSVRLLVETLAELDDGWQFMWDLRSARGRLSAEVAVALVHAQQEAAIARGRHPILVRPGSAHRLSWEFPWDLWQETQVIEMRPKPLVKRALDLAMFEDRDVDPYELVEALELSERAYVKVAIDLGMTGEDETIALLQSLELAGRQSLELPWASGDEYGALIEREASGLGELDTVWTEALQARRTAAVRHVLDLVATNSLLVQMALHVSAAGRIEVIPYHAYSLHALEVPRDELVLIRPGRRSAPYWRRFERAIDELENLLNLPRIPEREIERLLLENPLFLRGLNYGELYSQVILPRDDGSYLRPDLIAEPIGGRWADIIDLKLPTERILVGSKDRPRLASALAEAAAQLREYHAYFDDRTLARRIEQQLGIRCYKPKMVVIVGRDPTQFTPEQQRRAMTSYPSLEIVTYDQLLAAARTHLLL